MSFMGGVRKGGGFLNDVVIKIVGYTFENKVGKSGFAYVDTIIRYLQADQTVEQQTSLMLGGAENYVVSADGQTVTGPEGGPVVIDGKVGLGRFLVTLVESKFPEASLPDLEAGEPLTLKALIGYRLNVAQEVDPKAKTKRVDKNGKEWDRTRTIVNKVLGKEGGQGAAQGSFASQDNTLAALEAVTAILAKAGSLPKAQLNMKIVQAFGPASPIVSFLRDDKNLASLPGISIDLTTPARVVSLATVNA